MSATSAEVTAAPTRILVARIVNDSAFVPGKKSEKKNRQNIVWKLKEGGIIFWERFCSYVFDMNKNQYDPN